MRRHRIPFQEHRAPRYRLETSTKGGKAGLTHACPLQVAARAQSEAHVGIVAPTAYPTRDSTSEDAIGSALGASQSAAREAAVGGAISMRSRASSDAEICDLAASEEEIGADYVPRLPHPSVIPNLWELVRMTFLS